MTDQKYVRAVEVAKRNNLTGDTIHRFVRFLVEWSDLRGKDWTRDSGYNDEWAIRFKKEQEYVYASGDATVALVYVDGKKAPDIAAGQLKKVFGSEITKKEAKLEAISRIERGFESANIPLPETFRGFFVQPQSKKHHHHKGCICKSAGVMIGKLPDFNKNFDKIMK